MRIHSKKALLFLLLIPVCLLMGCAAKQAAANTAVLPAADLSAVQSGGIVTLTDDTCAAVFWKPKNNKSVLDKVSVWLKKAESYTGKIPKSEDTGPIAANIGPSVLYITAGNLKVSVSPAFYLTADDNHVFQKHYIKNVLILSFNGRENPIYSPGLYGWLKDDKWKAEFNRT